MSENVDSLEVIQSQRRVNLNLLPDLPVLMIASYLPTKDLLKFSHSCRSIYDIFNNNGEPWARLLKNETIEYWKDFRSAAMTIVGKQRMLTANNCDKLAFIICRRTKRNWTSPQSADMSYFGFESGQPSFSFLINHSSFYVAFMACQESVDGSLINFSIWDVRLGQSLALVLQEDIKLGKDEFYEVHLFNEFVLLDTRRSQGLERAKRRCYKFSLVDRTFERKWSMEKATTNIEAFFYERVFVDVSKCGGQGGHDDVDEILLEGYSTDNGSKLFEFKFDVPNYDMPIKPVASNAGWFLVNLPGKIIAINYESNYFKVLRDFNFELKKIVLKEDHAVCFYKNGTVNVYFLPHTNRVIFKFRKILDWDWDRVILDYDYKTQYPSIVYQDVLNRCWVYPTLYGWVKSNYNYNTSVYIGSRYAMLGNFIRLELPNDFGNKFCLKISRMVDGEKEIDYARDTLEHDARINSQSPFFVAVHNRDIVTIYDFINLKQYL